MFSYVFICLICPFHFMKLKDGSVSDSSPPCFSINWSADQSCPIYEVPINNNKRARCILVDTESLNEGEWIYIGKQIPKCINKKSRKRKTPVAHKEKYSAFLGLGRRRMTSLEEYENAHTNKGFDSVDLGVEQGEMSEVQFICFNIKGNKGLQNIY